MAPQTEVRGAPQSIDWSAFQGAPPGVDNAGKATLSADGATLHYPLLPGEAQARTFETFIALFEKTHAPLKIPADLRSEAGVEKFVKANPPLDVVYEKFLKTTTQALDFPRLDIRIPALEAKPNAPDANAATPVAAPLPPPAAIVDNAKKSGDPTLGFLADRLEPLTNLLKGSPALADYTRALDDAQKAFDGLNAKLKTAGSDSERAQIQGQLDALTRGLRSLRDAVNTDAPDSAEITQRSKQLSTQANGSGQITAQLKSALQSVPGDLLPMFDNPAFVELITKEPGVLDAAMKMPPDLAALKKLQPFIPPGASIKPAFDKAVSLLEKGDLLGLGGMMATGELGKLFADANQLKGGIALMQTALKDPKLLALLQSGLPIGSLMRGIQTGTINTDLMGKVLDGTADIAETMTLLRQMKAAAAPKPIVLDMKNPALLALAKATNLPIDPAQLESIQIGPDDKLTIKSKPGTKLNGSVLGSDASIDLPNPLELDISANNIDLVKKQVTAELGFGDTLHAAFVDLEFHPTGNEGFDKFLTVLAKIFLALPMFIAALFGARAKATMKQGPDGKTTTDLSFMGIKVGEAGAGAEKKADVGKSDGAAALPKTQDEAAALYGSSLGDLPPSIAKKHKLAELYKPIQQGQAKPEQIEALSKAIAAAKADAEQAATQPLTADIERWVTPQNGSGAHGSWAQTPGSLSFSTATDFVPDADPSEAHWQFTQMMSEVYDFPPGQINEILQANPELQKALDTWLSEKKPGGIELTLPETLVRSNAAPAQGPGQLRLGRTGQFGESVLDADTGKTSIKPFDDDRTDAGFVSAFARMYGTSHAEIEKRVQDGTLGELKTQWMTKGSTLELPDALPGGPAPPMTEQEQARERANDAFERGLAANKTSDFATAEAEFKAANALAPEPETFRAIGRAQARQGKKAEALATLDEGIALAKQRGDDALVKQLQDARAQVENGAVGPPLPQLPDALNGKKLSESDRAKATAPVLRALGFDVADTDVAKCGSLVRALQKKLGMSDVDGRWGPETQKALEAYVAKGGSVAQLAS